MRHRRQWIHRFLADPSPPRPRLLRPLHRQRSQFSSLFLFCSSIRLWLLNYLTILLAEDEKETKHLLSLEGAESRLRLFEMDLLNYDSIVAAVTGTTGVFHLASRCTVDKVPDPEVISSSLPSIFCAYLILILPLSRLSKE